MGSPTEMSWASPRPCGASGSRSTTRTPVPPSRRSEMAMKSSNPSAPVTNSSSVVRSSGTHSCADVHVIGAMASSKLVRLALWVTSSWSPIGSMSYSTPGRRSATIRGVPSGSAASSSRNSERRLRPDGDDDVAVVARGAHPDEEALVGSPRARGRPARPASRARGATPGRAATRRRPGCRRGAGRRATTRATRPSPARRRRGVSPVAMLPHPHVVALVAREVDGIRQQVARGRHLGGADPEEVVADGARRSGRGAPPRPRAAGRRTRAGRCGWSASEHPRPRRRTAPPRSCGSSTTSGRGAPAPRGRSPRCASGTPRRSARPAASGARSARWHGRSRRRAGRAAPATRGRPSTRRGPRSGHRGGRGRPGRDERSGAAACAQSRHPVGGRQRPRSPRTPGPLP